jgi:hypothetical protein
MLNKNNTNKGEKTMHVKAYRRIVINSSLNLYKDQERLLTYEGNLIRVVTAGRHKAGIVILNNDGTQSEEKIVDAMDLCNNLKIVNQNGDKEMERA